jgi:Heavy metal binding domain
MRPTIKFFFRFYLLTVVAVILIPSCGNSNQKANTPEKVVVKDQYQCPMKCTQEIFDKPGSCSVCGMELEKIANG